MMKFKVARAAAAIALLAAAAGLSAFSVFSCASQGHSGNVGPGSSGASSGGIGIDGGPTSGDDESDAQIFGGGGGGGPPTAGNCVGLKHACTSACSDFPSAAFIDSKPDDGSPAAPADAATHFSGTAATSGGPCILDPADGVIIPYNWVRPRFRIAPAAGQDLFQITLQTTREANPYVAYTKSTQFGLPNKVWSALVKTAWGDPVTVTIAGVNSSNNTSLTSSTSTFTIAPASAGGNMIYWAAVGDCVVANCSSATPPAGKNSWSWLEGFGPGDESVATTLTVPQVQETVVSGNGSVTNNGNGAGKIVCIGCHTAVPDGTSVTFDDWYLWPGVVANVDGDAGAVGATPPWLTPGGAQAYGLPGLGVSTFSPAVWDAGSHTVVTSYGCKDPAADAGMYTEQIWTADDTTCDKDQVGGLGWMDLSTTAPAFDAGSQNPFMVIQNLGKSFGIIPITNDPNIGHGGTGEFPNWKHDGSDILYVSTDAGVSGRLGIGSADLYTVPYNGRNGGMASPVMGASDPSAMEYYPSYSADDQFIAFNRATKPGAQGMYYNPYADVDIIPAVGGTPVRLAANDPPACQNVTNPLTNSWPKWSPDVETCDDKLTYYWIVFSSSRDGLAFNTKNFVMGTPDGPTSQLYMTSVTVDGSGKVTTHPALYIWNQPKKAANGDPQSNNTPIWEFVSIARPPTPVNN
jgi:hypothetical protein